MRTLAWAMIGLGVWCGLGYFAWALAYIAGESDRRSYEQRVRENQQGTYQVTTNGWRLRTMRQDDEPEPDEGAEIVQSAMRYLKPRADADYEDQELGDFEAYAILEEMLVLIAHEYECRFCGRSLGKKGRYCSANCAKADAEGL